MANAVVNGSLFTWILLMARLQSPPSFQLANRGNCGRAYVYPREYRGGECDQPVSAPLPASLQKPRPAERVRRPCVTLRITLVALRMRGHGCERSIDAHGL